MDYGREPSCGRRVLIYGENGTGKSHTAKSVARWAKAAHLHLKWVCRKEGSNGYGHSPECVFRNWPKLLADLKSGEWNLISELCDVELLVLDDVGADYDPSKFGVEKLYLLLEGRETKWTLITTNIGPDAWDTKFERRIASRFLRNFTHIPLTEVPDYNSR